MFWILKGLNKSLILEHVSVQVWNFQLTSAEFSLPKQVQSTPSFRYSRWVSSEEIAGSAAQSVQHDGALSICTDSMGDKSTQIYPYRYVCILMPGYMIVFLLANITLKRGNTQRSFEALTKGNLWSVQRKALPMTRYPGWPKGDWWIISTSVSL